MVFAGRLICNFVYFKPAVILRVSAASGTPAGVRKGIDSVPVVALEDSLTAGYYLEALRAEKQKTNTVKSE
jgi:hypothetical protein